MHASDKVQTWNRRATSSVVFSLSTRATRLRTEGLEDELLLLLPPPLPLPRSTRRRKQLCGCCRMISGDKDTDRRAKLVIAEAPCLLANQNRRRKEARIHTYIHIYTFVYIHALSLSAFYMLIVLSLCRLSTNRPALCWGLGRQRQRE